MTAPTIALALDAFSPVLLERWIDEGRLPVLARLRQQGIYGRIATADHPYEYSWLAFLHGASPGQTGQWTLYDYDPVHYTVSERSVYGFDGLAPFYALGDGTRVAVFDLPQTGVVDGVDGVQILGWGSEENLGLSIASPPTLIDEIQARHGMHPMHESAGLRILPGVGDAPAVSFRNPSLYDTAALLELKDRLLLGIQRRTAILHDLLDQGPWQFLLAAYGETHLAGHLFWHFRHAHPVREALDLPDIDPVLEIAEAVDASLGSLLARLPEDARLAVFSVHGMKANSLDLATTTFLPEFLYRLHFGSAALAEGQAGTPVPPPAGDYRRHWKDEMWALATAAGAEQLDSPQQLEARDDPLDWNPTVWYRPVWPGLPAFALPSYSDGMIRLNVQGRERTGVVAAADYPRHCADIIAALGHLRNARSGRPMVRDVLRVREQPFDTDPTQPTADLIVRWNDNESTDCVESPDIGRIGPIPYFRSGGHAAKGFCILKGPGIAEGVALTGANSVQDLSATLLAMLGRDIPAHITGRSLLFR
jgi:predicted AlkP superfamily phosphohydrolase/phosphomutase